MSDLEDPDLRLQLGRMGGAYPDTNAAFNDWQRRVGQARRRRAAVWGSAAVLTVLAGTAAAAVNRAENRQTLVPATVPDNTHERTTVPTTAAPTTQAPTTTEAPAPIDTTVQEVVVVNTDAPAAIDQTQATDGSGDSGNSGSGGSGGSGTPGHGTKVTVPPPPPAQNHVTRTFNSVGGSITVKLDGGQLSVASIKDSPGFRHTVDNSGDALRITFRSDAHRSRISIRVDHAAVIGDVQESGGDHGNSGPPSTD